MGAAISDKNTVINFQIPKKLKAKLDKHCKKSNIFMSYYLRQIIEESLTKPKELKG